jgi:hypothetical protein
MCSISPNCISAPADKAINNTEKKAVNRTTGFDLKQPPCPEDDVFCCCLENDCLFVEIPVITEDLAEPTDKFDIDSGK